MILYLPPKLRPSNGSFLTAGSGVGGEGTSSFPAGVGAESGEPGVGVGDCAEGAGGWSRDSSTMISRYAMQGSHL